MTEDTNVVKLPTRRSKTTLGALGSRLPVGFKMQDGSLSKDIVSKAWKTRDERAIGQLRSTKMNMAEYAVLVLSQMYTRIGPHIWDAETKQEQKQLVIGQLYMPDVLYMYLWLRTQVISPELKMNVVCSSCNAKFVFVGDMMDIEVQTIESAELMDWHFELKDPISIRKQPVERFRIRSPQWMQFMGMITDDFNENSAKIGMVQASIVGLNNEPEDTRLTGLELDELSKRDLEALSAKINEDFLGPKMVLEGACKKCKHEFVKSIDWRHDTFFAVSSP